MQRCVHGLLRGRGATVVLVTHLRARLHPFTCTYSQPRPQPQL